MIAEHVRLYGVRFTAVSDVFARFAAAAGGECKNQKRNDDVFTTNQNIASATTATKRFQNSRSLQSQCTSVRRLRLQTYSYTVGIYIFDGRDGNTNIISAAAVTTANFPAHIMRYASIVRDIGTYQPCHTTKKIVDNFTG